MALQPDQQPPPCLLPALSRQRQKGFGRVDYDRFDHLAISSASIGQERIGGKATIDVKFLFKKSKWGVMGENSKPAGILYMDLCFNLPGDCQLKHATVRVKVDDTDPALSRMSTNSHQADARHGFQQPFQPVQPVQPVQLTDWFGPKRLTGEQRKKSKKRTNHFTPHLNFMGTGAGGVGTDFETTVEESYRWSFSGQILTGDSTFRPSRTPGPGVWMLYRTLEWELSENELESKAAHSNVVHTAFAFNHGEQPFFLVVEIEGKLVKASRSRLLKFGRTKSGEETRSVTLVNLDKFIPKINILDQLARSLPEAMEAENYRAIPPELPDALPITFQTLPPYIGQSHLAVSQLVSPVGIDGGPQSPLGGTNPHHLEGQQRNSPLRLPTADEFPSGPSLEELARHALLPPPDPPVPNPPAPNLPVPNPPPPDFPAAGPPVPDVLAQPITSCPTEDGSTSSRFKSDSTLMGSEVSDSKTRRYDDSSNPSADIKVHFTYLIWAIYLTCSGLLLTAWKLVITLPVPLQQSINKSKSADEKQGQETEVDPPMPALETPNPTTNRMYVLEQAGLGDDSKVRKRLQRCMSL